MKTRIYVNRHILRRNARTGERTPPLSVRTSKGVRRALSVWLDGPCRLVYAPDAPLPCGATVWIETEGKVVARRTHGR